MRKHIFLLKRPIESAVADFQTAMLALRNDDPALPEGCSYVQSHTLPKGYGRGELMFDVVEEFAFADSRSCDRFRMSAAAAELFARRMRLADQQASMAMTVDVHRVKDGQISANPVKNIEFVNRRPGMAIAPFRDYWRNIHGPIGSEIPTIQRYEQNHTVRDAYDDANQPRFDGLAITWFASTAAMRKGAQSEAYRITREDEANFLPDGHLPIIIVTEVLQDLTSSEQEAQ
ncbi:EthD domain-containing protein [Paracoccus sp. (in: a-proteobacteria)]|uniref:EthD domain-containing protein n=1 Tax=Paracoccus sp. TaxID=267 RepID=UPI002AFEFAF0|nr:EthD domain-containing protein [Paracoccus sp. (in: a-proteobacteria)]